MSFNLGVSNHPVSRLGGLSSIGIYLYEDFYSRVLNRHKFKRFTIDSGLICSPLKESLKLYRNSSRFLRRSTRRICVVRPSSSISKSGRNKIRNWRTKITKLGELLERPKSQNATT